MVETWRTWRLGGEKLIFTDTEHKISTAGLRKSVSYFRFSLLGNNAIIHS
jgi:hypothetical protein